MYMYSYYKEKQNHSVDQSIAFLCIEMRQPNYFKKLQPCMGTEFVIHFSWVKTYMYNGIVLPPQTIHSFILFSINQSLLYLTAKTTGQSKESYSKP